MGMPIHVYGPIGISVGLVGVAVSAYQSYKSREKTDATMHKLDLTLDDINKKAPVDIEDAVVNKAIERAVEREVRIAVNDTARRVREDIHDEIKKEVKKEVEAQYNKIAEEVSDKISDQVAQIDEYALKDRVTKKAEEKVMRKLDGCLDGALGMFNNQLGNVNKIYQNIADTISGNKNNNQGFNLKIG